MRVRIFFFPFAICVLCFCADLWETDEADALDEYLSQETGYDPLLERLKREEGGEDDEHESGLANGKGPSFDDEDYDNIFMDILSSQEGSGPLPSQSMDTSGG